jgi:hypothetical protein
VSGWVTSMIAIALLSSRELFAKVCFFDRHERRSVFWEETRPNGQPRRCLNMSRHKKGFGNAPYQNEKSGTRSSSASTLLP